MFVAVLYWRVLSLSTNLKRIGLQVETNHYHYHYRYGVTGNSLETLVVSTMSECVGYECTNRDDKKTRQSGITFHNVSWLSDFFKYRYF